MYLHICFYLVLMPYATYTAKTRTNRSTHTLAPERTRPNPKVSQAQRMSQDDRVRSHFLLGNFVLL